MPFTTLIALSVTFLASLLGPLCGIGGGVIIKPVVDALGVIPVAEVSFLSSVSVLAMSASTLMQDALSRAFAGRRWGRSAVLPGDGRGACQAEAAPAGFRLRIAAASDAPLAGLLPIALGSAVGGVIGKLAFSRLMAAFPQAERIGAVQAGALVACALAALVYLHGRARGRFGGLLLTGAAAEATVGCAAGACWAFLGIGGGPFNVAILALFFSMGGKRAARASLFIIACSQTASFAYLVLASQVPAVPPEMLTGMVAAAVGGSVVGRRLSASLDDAATGALTGAALVLIILVSLYNMARFLAL